MGADMSSPEKQPSTKQSEEEDDHFVSNSASKSSKVTIIPINIKSNTFQAQKQVVITQSPQKQDPNATTGKNMDNYLSLENLKHLERISQCVKLDFSFFIKDMLKQETNESETQDQTKFIKDKEHLSIQNLQQRTLHLQRNKLSDKFSRRDIQFYDLYVKKENGEELGLLKDNQFPLDIDAELYYQEMEIDDFNLLFANNMLIEERFGKTIKVEVTRDSKNQKLSRKIKEHPELVKISDNRRSSSDIQQSSLKHKVDQKDPELLSIHTSLKQFENDYGKTHEELAEIYCRVSGRLNKMKDYLENRAVIEWSYLEDLALAKPDDSAEFQVLLSTKGWDEIMIRRDFLHATPVISEEESKQ